jgi:uncharacterized membrane protein YvlD (DUF360 family)
MWSKEEYILIAACVIGILTMLIHQSYQDDRILIFLAIPLSMMIFVRHQLWKDLKNQDQDPSE